MFIQYQVQYFNWATKQNLCPIPSYWLVDLSWFGIHNWVKWSETATIWRLLVKLPCSQSNPSRYSRHTSFAYVQSCTSFEISTNTFISSVLGCKFKPRMCLSSWQMTTYSLQINKSGSFDDDTGLWAGRPISNHFHRLLNSFCRVGVATQLYSIKTQIALPWTSKIAIP